jgi:hypothetical protein
MQGAGWQGYSEELFFTEHWGNRLSIATIQAKKVCFWEINLISRHCISIQIRSGPHFGVHIASY